VLLNALSPILRRQLLKVLVAREEEVTRKLGELETIGLADASVKKDEIEKLYNALNEVSDHTFITLPVFTAGTLSNSNRHKP